MATPWLAAYARTAGRAQRAFEDKGGAQVRMIDEAGPLRGLADVMADLQARYSEGFTDQANFELQQAFGSDEAVRLISALWGQEAAIRANAGALADADALQERFPAISAAATEVLATTSTVLAQITASLAALDYADEGARFVASIAEGIGLVAHWFHLKGRVAILETRQDIQSKPHEDTLDRIDRKLERIERKLDGKVDN